MSISDGSGTVQAGHGGGSQHLHHVFMWSNVFQKALAQAIHRFEGARASIRFLLEEPLQYLRLRFQQGLSLKVIAQRLGHSVRTLRRIMDQAHQVVYQYLTWYSMEFAEFFCLAYHLPFPA